MSLFINSLESNWKQDENSLPSQPRRPFVNESVIYGVLVFTEVYLCKVLQLICLPM